MPAPRECRISPIARRPQNGSTWTRQATSSDFHDEALRCVRFASHSAPSSDTVTFAARGSMYSPRADCTVRPARYSSASAFRRNPAFSRDWWPDRGNGRDTAALSVPIGLDAAHVVTLSSDQPHRATDVARAPGDAERLRGLPRVCRFASEPARHRSDRTRRHVVARRLRRSRPNRTRTPSSDSTTSTPHRHPPSSQVTLTHNSSSSPRSAPRSSAPRLSLPPLVLSPLVSLPLAISFPPLLLLCFHIHPASCLALSWPATCTSEPPTHNCSCSSSCVWVVRKPRQRRWQARTGQDARNPSPDPSHPTRYLARGLATHTPAASERLLPTGGETSLPLSSRGCAPSRREGQAQRRQPPT